MRYVLVAGIVTFLITAVAYKSNGSVQDYMAYANNLSHNFAKGENGKAWGWQPCDKVIDKDPDDRLLGVVCDGTRAILVRDHKALGVNYFCEFQFKHLANGSYKVAYALCQ